MAAIAASLEGRPARISIDIMNCGTPVSTVAAAPPAIVSGAFRKDFEELLALFEGLLDETRYVGEVGLDAGPRFFKTMPRQTTVFRRVLALCAEHGHKVLSVHSVRTAMLRAREFSEGTICFCS